MADGNTNPEGELEPFKKPYEPRQKYTQAVPLVEKQPKISRRNFLEVLGAATVGAIAGFIGLKSYQLGDQQRAERLSDNQASAPTETPRILEVKPFENPEKVK